MKWIRKNKPVLLQFAALFVKKIFTFESEPQELKKRGVVLSDVVVVLLSFILCVSELLRV